MNRNSAVKMIAHWHANNERQRGYLPFFFNGIEGLRFLGQAENTAQCDALLFDSRLSATFISTAEIATGERAFIAHS